MHAHMRAHTLTNMEHHLEICLAPKVRDSPCSVLRLQEWALWVPEIGKLTSLNHKQNYRLLLWEDLVLNIACFHCQAALDSLSPSCHSPQRPHLHVLFVNKITTEAPAFAPLRLSQFSGEN